MRRSCSSCCRIRRASCRRWRSGCTRFARYRLPPVGVGSRVGFRSMPSASDALLPDSACFAMLRGFFKPFRRLKGLTCWPSLIALHISMRSPKRIDSCGRCSLSSSSSGPGPSRTPRVPSTRSASLTPRMRLSTCASLLRGARIVAIQAPHKAGYAERSLSDQRSQPRSSTCTSPPCQRISTEAWPICSPVAASRRNRPNTVVTSIPATVSHGAPGPATSAMTPAA